MSTEKKKRKWLKIPFFMFNTEDKWMQTYLCIELNKCQYKTLQINVASYNFYNGPIRRVLFFQLYRCGNYIPGRIRHFPGMKQLESNVTRLKILSVVLQIPCSFHYCNSVCVYVYAGWQQWSLFTAKLLYIHEGNQSVSQMTSHYA